MIREKKRIALQLSPLVMWLGIFIFFPLLMVIVSSFFKKGPFGQILPEWNISNYSRVFEPVYLKIILKSFALGLYTSLTCLLLALPISYLMVRAKPFHKNLLLLLVIIPFWSNFIIRIYALKLMLNENGLINQLLLALHWIQEPLILMSNLFGVSVGMVYNYLPFMILPLYASMEKVDFTLLDAAYDLGANRAQMLLKILLPLILPGIFTGCLFVFIPAFGEFVIPDLLGGSQSMFVGNLITETFLKSRDWPFGSALSTLLVLFTMLSFVFLLRKSKYV